MPGTGQCRGHTQSGSDGYTLNEAEELCEAAGARLCTAAELNLNCAAGSGCGFDYEPIWTKAQKPHRRCLLLPATSLASHSPAPHSPAAATSGLRTAPSRAASSSCPAATTAAPPTSRRAPASATPTPSAPPGCAASNARMARRFRAATVPEGAVTGTTATTRRARPGRPPARSPRHANADFGTGEARQRSGCANASVARSAPDPTRTSSTKSRSQAPSRHPSWLMMRCAPFHSPPPTHSFVRLGSLLTTGRGSASRPGGGEHRGQLRRSPRPAGGC